MGPAIPCSAVKRVLAAQGRMMGVGAKNLCGARVIRDEEGEVKIAAVTSPCNVIHRVASCQNIQKHGDQ